MTSKMTQHVDHSEDFIEAHVESWLKIFGYARHCACVGSTRGALLCKCTRLCWATHEWPRNKENVEPCKTKSLTSFKFDSTVSTPLTPLNRVFKCAQLVKSFYSGLIHICTLLKVAKHSFQVPMPNSPLLLNYSWFGARFLQEWMVTTEELILAFWLRCVLLPWQRGWLKTRLKKWFLFI